jgi:hypothetical protein
MASLKIVRICTEKLKSAPDMPPCLGWGAEELFLFFTNCVVKIINE